MSYDILMETLYGKCIELLSRHRLQNIKLEDVQNKNKYYGPK